MAYNRLIEAKQVRLFLRGKPQPTMLEQHVKRNMENAAKRHKPAKQRDDL